MNFKLECVKNHVVPPYQVGTVSFDYAGIGRVFVQLVWHPVHITENLGMPWDECGQFITNQNDYPFIRHAGQEYMARLRSAARVIGNYRRGTRHRQTMKFKDLMYDGFVIGNRISSFVAKERLDRLIEYATRPGSEWTQQLYKWQTTGTRPKK